MLSRTPMVNTEGDFRIMEGPSIWRRQYLCPFQAWRACCRPRRLNPGKSPGLDSIFTEFILHVAPALKSWFCDFLISCMRQLKIPIIWRRAPIVLIPMLEKSLGDSKSYRPVSLLSIPVKTLEGLTYVRVELLIDILLPHEEAGFRHERSSIDQVTLLNQDTEDSFSAMKTGAVFVDLTGAYDNVWHRGLTCKLLRLLRDRHMVYLILEMVGNRSFTLTTGNGKQSRLRRLKNDFHRDLSWQPFSSKSTSLTCQPPSPESMHMLTI